MNDISLPIMAEQSCWSRIGVWGNSTCPELPRVHHCRNCEVYAAGGRRLFDRPVPQEYIESWSAFLEEDKGIAEIATSPHLVFQIGQLWLAFAATSLREITEPKVVRRVPHRPLESLLGLVNVRGELYPCVSLHALFGEEAPASLPRTARFFVARWTSGDWVFPVDRVDGMREVSEPQIEQLPATLQIVGAVYTRGLFHQGGKTVAVIDEQVLFPALERRIA
jgi:chemotaxis-related protein WspD